MPYVQANHVELSCEESGTGDPLVLVHGAWSDHTPVTRAIHELQGADLEAAVAFSLRAWAPVFTSLEAALGRKLRPTVPRLAFGTSQRHQSHL
jgi:hypothetical protein